MRNNLFKIAIVIMALACYSLVPDQSTTSNEDIIASMPDNVYESVSLSAGDGASVDELAAEYLNNKSYYDSLEENTVKAIN